MCLEFLFRHRDEDGPDHGRSQNTRTGLSASSSPNYSREHNKENNYPTKDEPPPKGGNQFPSGVVVNGDTIVQAVRPKTSSMAFNGEKVAKTVNGKPHDSVPYVGNNTTVLAAPVQQPNLRIGANSDVVPTNGHYPALDDSGRRNPNMRKYEEEDEEEEEARVPKVAQLMKNRRY